MGMHVNLQHGTSFWVGGKEKDLKAVKNKSQNGSRPDRFGGKKAGNAVNISPKIPLRPMAHELT
jgi:hypothetical protein